MYLYKKRKLLQTFAPGWLADFRSRSIVLVAGVVFVTGGTFVLSPLPFVMRCDLGIVTSSVPLSGLFDWAVKIKLVWFIIFYVITFP